MRGFITRAVASGLVLLILVVIGCKSGGRSSAVTAEVVPGQVEGTWLATVTHSVTTTCGEQTHDVTFTMFITQDGKNVSFTTDAGYSGSGVLEGNKLNFTYSFPDGAGTTTSTVALEFESLQDPGSNFMDSFSGSANYVYVDGANDCDGSDSWSGSRIPDAPPPDGQGLTGLWNLTLTSVMTTCGENPQEDVTIPVEVLEVEDDVTITIPGLVEFSGSYLVSGGNEVSIYGEYQDQEFYVVASGILTVSADENTVTGLIHYDYFDQQDPANDCQGDVDWLMERVSAPVP